MPLDAFSQAFTSTDWDKVAAAARPVPVAASASAAALAAAAKARSGLSAGDAAKAADKAKSADDQDFLTFDDVLDIVNPLQHIPIVDAIYRRLTGDTIRPQAEVLGGFLYGGLIGGAIATGSVLFTEATGIDPLPDVIAWIAGDDSPSQTQVAAAPATPAPAQPASPGRSAPTPLMTPAGRPMPVAASAETMARRNLTAANRNALQLLAQDLAAGGQLGGDSPAAAAPAPQPVAPQPVTPQPVTPSPPAPTPAPAPQPVQTAEAAGLPQPHPTRMPARGVPTNAQMPPPVPAFGRRFGGYARTTNAPAVAAPPPVVTLPMGADMAIRPLDAAPDIKPLNAAVAAAPQTAAPQSSMPQSSMPLDPQVLGPDGIQQLMMRNLEKYQAMSRRPARTAAATATSG